MTAKKRTKKRDACAKLLFCQSKPIAFLPFSLPTPSSLLKLPNYGLCIKVGTGQGDGDIGTRVWGLGDARRRTWGHQVWDAGTCGTGTWGRQIQGRRGRGM